MNKNLLNFEYEFSVDPLKIFKGGTTVKECITEELRCGFYEGRDLLVETVAQELNGYKGYFLPSKLTFDEFMYCVNIDENDIKLYSVSMAKDDVWEDAEGNPVDAETNEKLDEVFSEEKEDLKKDKLYFITHITFDIDKALVFFNK